MDLGWWLGHAFELVGIALVGGSVAYDLAAAASPARSSATCAPARSSRPRSIPRRHASARSWSAWPRRTRRPRSTHAVSPLLAVQLGEELGLAPRRLRTLAIGGLLHDIGKLSIPDSILQKPAPLDDDEFAVIKQHPERGRELLSELGGFDESVQRLVLDHHERLDGTGYPRGLDADDLDLETRILTVCDVYDALVSPRVYRAAWPPEPSRSCTRRRTASTPAASRR